MKIRLLTLSVISFLFLFSCGDDDTEMDTDPESSKNIAYFTISSKKNSIKDDIIGQIDEGKKTITLTSYQWIDKIESLIPTFEVKGTISVNNNILESNQSSINLLQGTIICQVTDDSNNIHEYKLSLICPQTTGLPIIKIDVEDGKEITQKTESYFDAEISIIDNNRDEYSLQSTVGIRGRGNSTWKYAKKPYRLKFDKKTSLFGLGAEKSWVLLANYLDPTLLMTAVAFEAGHRAKANYTNHEIACELFMNGTYRGHYTLTEQVQVNKNRVDVDKDNGFLIEIDHYYDDTPKFRTEILDLPIMVKSPDAENLSEVKWVKDFFQEFENEFMKDDYNITGKYKNYIDINSVINYMIVNEIACNGDLYPPKSLFIHKGVNSKMAFGPIWDFDWAYGKNTAAGEFVFFENPDKTIFSPTPTTDQAGCQLFARFLQDPEFLALYKARWNELKTNGLLNFDQFIDNKVIEIEFSQQLNFNLWENRLDFQEQIDKMKLWMNKHIAYVDKAINNDFK